MAGKALLTSLFLPPISIVARILNCDEITLEKCETYQKRSYRNRCYIADAQGRKLTSVPLRKGKHESLVIDQVLIAYDDSWHITLCRMLKASYGSAPFFDFYYDEYCQVFMNESPTLWELNLSLLRLTLAQLGYEGSITESTSYMTCYDEHEYVDLRHLSSIKSNKMDSYAYAQVFMDKHGFIPNLSIMDLLMCCGPESTSVLRQLQSKN